MCFFFKNLTTIKYLYNCLIRSILEYASVTWSPWYKNSTIRLERIQNRFLRYLYYRKHNVYPHYYKHPVKTEDLLKEFKIQSLYNRRLISECLFIYKLLRGKVECQYLLSEIKFKTKATQTRACQTFYIPRLRLNCSVSPLIRALITVNNLPQNVDIFNVSMQAFGKELSVYFL